MNTYFNSEDLVDKILEYGDVVYLAGIKYVVDEFSLTTNMGSSRDEKIFKILEIDDKKHFCEKHYGYDPFWHYGFPRPNKGDFKALTRVVIALMHIYEKPGKWLQVTKYVKKHFN